MSSSTRRRRNKLLIRPAQPRDRHQLYQEAVQCPEADIRFFDRVYRNVNDRWPKFLREDFCGTAAISAEWARKRRDNLALGVDLDLPTLEWGRRHNLASLGPDEERVQLIQADVRSVRRPKVDVIAALNFSYFVFKTRRELLRYFRGARASLATGGIFVTDIFGGYEAQSLDVETKRRKGFTYVWDQVSFDPISHDVLFHIHFRFPDGTEMRRAFTYDWRFWTIPEVRELMAEAGFARSEVFWEGTESDTGDGNGVFRVARQAATCPGWIAYVVGYRG